MAKGKKRKSVKDIINTEVEEAVENAELLESEFEDQESPEEFEQRLAVSQFNASSGDEVDAKDVFIEAWEKAKAKNTTPRFRIYKNNALVGTEEGKYSFEKLQPKYGHGDFKIVAVDRNNHFLGSQVIEIGPPPGYVETFGQPPPPTPQPTQPGAIELMEVMRQTQREAKEEIQNSRGGDTTALAAMMTAMTQSQQTMMTALMNQQQLATQNFQNMMLEMNKQSQAAQLAQQNLMLSIINRKPDDAGIKPTELIKMLEEAKRDAKNEARENYKLIEEKVEERAEERAQILSEQRDGDDEKKEGGLKGMIQDILPILGTMAKNNAGTQPQTVRQAEPLPPARVPAPGEMTVEQNAVMRVEAERRAHFERVANQRKAAERIQRDRPNNVPANFAQPPRTTAATPPKGPVVDVTTQAGVKSGPATGEPSGSLTTAEGRPGRGPIVIKTKLESGNGASMEPIREKIFDIVGQDIGMALLTQKDAKDSAAECLKTLDLAGIPPQTVLEVFSFKDLIRYAMNNGVPETGEPWLQEFYDGLKKTSASLSAPRGDGNRTRAQSPEPS